MQMRNNTQELICQGLFHKILKSTTKAAFVFRNPASMSSSPRSLRFSSVNRPLLPAKGYFRFAESCKFDLRVVISDISHKGMGGASWKQMSFWLLLNPPAYVRGKLRIFLRFRGVIWSLTRLLGSAMYFFFLH